MNNTIIFAAAGNGKTYNICKEAVDLAEKNNKYILLLSYTNEGVHSLKTEYQKQNYGVIDKNVIIKTWYSFLLSELIKPYQCLLKLNSNKTEHNIIIPENYIKSIAFYQDEQPPRGCTSSHIQYYINSARDIRKDNVSHLAVLCIEHSEKKVINRLQSIYSHIFIDELQDYAGWDLDIFEKLFESNIKVKCVGDYKQATFRTNNSSKNKQYRDENIKNYFEVQEKKNLCSILYENTTRRFNQEICNYINTIHNDNTSTISPYKVGLNCDVENIGVYILDNKYMEEYCCYYSPTILRYNKSSKIPFRHNCQVFNYGNSKGATFERTVIIPVSTVIPFIKKNNEISSKQTRSKFYVACTRAKYSIVFAMDNPQETINFKKVDLMLGKSIIPALKYDNNEDHVRKNFR